MNRSPLTVLLYGDVNLNILDGSSIWLQSMAEALSHAGVTTHVLLKSSIRNRRIVDALERLDGVHLIAQSGSADADGPEQSHSPRRAAQLVAEHDARVEADVIICRGLAVCYRVVLNRSLAGRLWSYVTELPSVRAGAAAPSDELRAVAEGSRVLLAQTEDARAYLEALVPAAAGKTLLLPPMVPDALFEGPVPAVPLGPGEPVRLVYSGKFAKAWRTLEMPGLPAQLTARGVPTTLTMIGDKVQDDPVDKEWSTRMRAVVETEGSAADVRWVGGLPRAEALELVSQHHVGLGWRAPSLDGSVELSTKLLEYAALGVPPLVNRTAAHELLLGADYPLFTDAARSVESVVEAVASSPELLDRAARTARDAVRDYAVTAAGCRLATRLSRYAVRRPPTGPAAGGRTKVVVAGHDFKFAADVFNALSASPERYEVRVDKWSSLHVHDESRSRELVDWADVVFCEWAGPNSAWYSQHKRLRQKLVVRFHGFEVRGPWLARLDVRAVDRVIFVSDFYHREMVDTLGWADVHTVTIPNSVDTLDLDRTKLPGARFHLGLLGVVPMRKRPDRALALLSELVAHDERFVLHLKGHAPWNYPWEWKSPLQRDAYEGLLEGAASSGLLDHVAFERFGPGVGSWNRKIGWVLSPSAQETFHLSPLEGMAAGSVPVFWPRPGVTDIFGERWLVDDEVDARDRILEAVSSDGFDKESQAAKEYAAVYDIATVRRAWAALFEAL